MSTFSPRQNDEEGTIRERIDSLTSDPLRKEALRWALLSSPKDEEVEKTASTRKVRFFTQNSLASTHTSSSECMISADSSVCSEHESVGACEEFCLSPRSDTTKNGMGEKYDGEWEKKMPTTIKMRNIPKSYTNSHLIDLLHHYEYLPCVDFLYVFIRSIQRNVGVAVINFTSHTEAMQFLAQFQGFDKWHLTPSSTASASMPIGPKNASPRSLAKCSLEWNEDLQGRDELINYYRDGPIMHQLVPQDFKPLLFKQGTPEAFPSPRRVVRRPQKRILQLFKEFASNSGGERECVSVQPYGKRDNRVVRFRVQ